MTTQGPTELPMQRLHLLEGIGHVVRVWLDDDLGHLLVEHDGSITWDDLQDLKNSIWGDEARAIEVYPPVSQIVNNAPIRHLWRLGETDFAPDLLGADRSEDSLQTRCATAWAEARG